MTEQAGYVEYGVRCPDGTVRATAPTRTEADWHRYLANEGHICAEPHEVVQHTVGPWEVAR